MHIDLLNSLRTPRDLSHDDPKPRQAPIPQSLASMVVEHLTHHAASDRLKESLAQWGSEHGKTGGQSQHGWPSPQNSAGAVTESPLHLVLQDILEEINGGTGSNLNVEIDDAYTHEDLFHDLAQIFAQRRQPIGDNDVGSQSDFGSANNPFCGVLFAAWEMEGDLAALRDRYNASLLLLLKLIAVLGRRKLLTLLDINKDDGQARYEPDDQDLLFEIAQFMDQHPARYPPPSPLNAEVWTWTQRIAHGSWLDARETRLFQLALEQLDFALARLAGQHVTIRRRGKRSREETEFHLSVTGSARNVLRLMCA